EKYVYKPIKLPAALARTLWSKGFIEIEGGAVDIKRIYVPDPALGWKSKRLVPCFLPWEQPGQQPSFRQNFEGQLLLRVRMQKMMQLIAGLPAWKLPEFFVAYKIFRDLSWGIEPAESAAVLVFADQRYEVEEVA